MNWNRTWPMGAAPVTPSIGEHPKVKSEGRQRGVAIPLNLRPI